MKASIPSTEPPESNAYLRERFRRTGQGLDLDKAPTRHKVMAIRRGVVRGTDNPPRDFAGDGAPGVFLLCKLQVRLTALCCLAFQRIALSIVRAAVFIDGNNWYHGLRRLGLDSHRLDYQRLARKLLVDRQLLGIRYYIGRVSKDLRRMRHQDRALATLRGQGVEVKLGRIEKNTLPMHNPLSQRLRALVADSRDVLPLHVAEQLDSLCNAEVPYYVEKQVDVLIAVDLVSLAHQDDYDVAYLLSADGDFVPAVREVQRLGKRVFAASTLKGNQLATQADAFINLPRDWFHGMDL